VLASDRRRCGDGRDDGHFVGAEAPVAEWAAAPGDLIDDPVRYQAAADAARPTHIVKRSTRM
jgi:hypothetical protein